MQKDNLSDLVQLDEIAKKHRKALATALDLEKNKKGKVYAQKVNMGSFISKTGPNKLIPSYVTVQTLRYASEHVKMGSEMPFMKDKIDEKTRKLIIDKDNIQSVMQRAPDWTRQIALTAYLLANKNHKFTTILAVIEPAWINEATHDNWDEDGRAIKNAIDFEPLDSNGSIGLLDIENVTIYALDGQHRIMGIKGIQDLQENNFFLKTRNNKPKGDSISREEFLTGLGVDSSILNRILEETLSIEFIPAVVTGETREEARRRLRSYFVSINTYAKKVSKGEGSLLDEEDGYKIVAKDLALEHPIFQTPGENKHRINMQDQAIPKTSNWITTLEAITNMSERFLSKTDESRNNKWQNKFKGKGSLKIRPSEEELNKAKKEFKTFLDLMHNLSIFQKIDRGESVQKLREFPDKKNENNEGHLLLRPIGQQILADAVGQLIKEGGNIENIFKKIELIDNNGQFNAYKEGSIFFGVTVDISKKRMITSNQQSAATYLMYLVKGGNSNEMTKYIKDLMNKRSDPTDLDKWINFKGKIVKKGNNDYTQLPRPVS